MLMLTCICSPLFWKLLPFLDVALLTYFTLKSPHLFQFFNPFFLFSFISSFVGIQTSNSVDHCWIWAGAKFLILAASMSHWASSQLSPPSVSRPFIIHVTPPTPFWYRLLSRTWCLIVLSYFFKGLHTLTLHQQHYAAARPKSQPLDLFHVT